MNKTITSVNEEPRHWTSDDGKISLAFLTVTFGDGSQGSIACKPENAENVTKILNGLKGKEADFQLEAKPDYNGTKQWKVTGYPGKPGSQDGQNRGFPPPGPRQRHDPLTNASIEAQVAAKIAGEMAVSLIASSKPLNADPVSFVAHAIPRITAAIRQAARGEKSESTGAPSSGGPLPPPDSDDPPKGGEAEGVAPGVTPSGQDLGWGTGPMTAKQKAKLNTLYEGKPSRVLVAARAMFPEVQKVADLSEDQAAALIEDKEQG